MGFFLPVLGALTGGITNVLANEQQVSQQNANVSAAAGILRQNLLSDKDLNDLLLSNKRYFNSNISNLLNSTAISNRGVANAPVVAGAVASRVVGQESQSAMNIQENAIKQNSDVNNRIAALDMQRGSTSTIADFFGGAIGGLTAGMSANKYMDAVSKDPNVTTTGDPSLTGQPTSRLNGFLPPTLSMQSPYVPQATMGTGGMQNPFGGKANNPFVDYLGHDQMSLRNNAMFSFNYN